MSKSDAVPSSMGVRKTQETICDAHKQQYFMSGYEAGLRDDPALPVSRRREAELAALNAAIPAMSDVLDAVTAVLIAHSRLNSEGCVCGWSVLGAQHSRHQAEALRTAGLLR